MNEVKEFILSDGNILSLKPMNIEKYWEIAALYRSNKDSLLLEKGLIINTIVSWTFKDASDDPLPINLANFAKNVRADNYLELVAEVEAINKLSPPEKNALPAQSAEV